MMYLINLYLLYSITFLFILIMEKFLLLSLLFSMAIITCSATTYTVGDNSGWDISSNLETWVADKTFKIGDALRKFLNLLFGH